jgi:hypothetical protein
MITEAVQGKLDAIITSYAHIAPEDVTAPFCVHIEKGVPIRTKKGIEGFTWDIEVVLIALDPASRETYTQSIIAALESMSGNTINNTIVDEATYVSDTPLFDEETLLYGTNILFNVISSNR